MADGRTLGPRIRCSHTTKHGWAVKYMETRGRGRARDRYSSAMLLLKSGQARVQTGLSIALFSFGIQCFPIQFQDESVNPNILTMDK
jgi:hypothetical protein